MKIAWLTPTNNKSAIFEYSKIVVNELIKYVEVTTFGTTESAEGINSDYYPLNDELIIQKLNVFDIVIYNMGDHQPYHQKIFETYLKLPGVVILHDLYFRNFFSGYFAKIKNGIELQEKSSEYTKDYITNKVDAKTAFNFFGSNSYINGSLKPLFEPVVSNALGVIVHCEEAKNIISKLFPIPNISINLPYESNMAKEKNISSDVIEITTIGRVNKEKRYDLVIEALSLDKSLKEKVHYNIVGLYDEKGSYFNNLVNTVNKLNLTKTVTFHGEVTKKQMNDIFTKTNIFTNLRKPCLNTGSWSLVEELASGKAIIANNFGYARSIPDDCIVKLENVKQKDEAESLLNAIQKLISNPLIRNKYAINGKNYIKNNNSPDSYCKNLILFAKEIILNKSLKYQQEMSSISATYESLVFTSSNTFNSFFNFSGIIKK